MDKQIWTILEVGAHDDDNYIESYMRTHKERAQFLVDNGWKVIETRKGN